MKKRWILPLVIVVLLLGGVCLILSHNRKTDIEPEEEKKLQIGMSFDSFVIERWLRDRDVFVSTAKELGAEVNVQNANGDIAEQKKQIDYFIDKGVDAIVIICIGSYGLREQVERALDAGIKVVAYDRQIAEGNVDLYISFDNSRVGEMMGQALAENGIQGKNVLMLGGSPTDSNVPLVEGAFCEVMEANHNTILDVFHADNW